jgi:putative peptidoglycan lipid II flippase
VLLASLYSVRRFTAPAFATVCFHVGIIAGAIFLARPLGIVALPIGALAGAAAQTAVQVPALIRAGLRPRVRVSLTPEVRTILKLYAPGAAGLIVSIVGQGVDLNFKSELQSGAITWMYVATTLTQFPIGIAVAAIGFAVLPSLSSDAAFERMSEFKDTLALGIRLVLFLTVPAAIGYVVLGVPVTRLLFQHGHFHSGDTIHTAQALAGYAPQIPFVGLDQLLIFAFYARKNTLTPMLVGVLGVAIYVVAGLLLLPRLHVFGLAFANTLQNSLHGLILLALLLPAIGPFGGRGIVSSLGKTCIAGGAMALAGALVLSALHPPASPGVGVELADLALPAVAAGTAYVAAATLLRSDELSAVIGLARRLRA